MLPSKDLVLCLILLSVFVNNTKCEVIEKMSKTLDEILVNTRSFRRPRDYADTSLIWHEYEFGTGVGNREEVVVTDISLNMFANMPENVDWQFLQTDTACFFRAENSTLLFYKINLEDLSIEHIMSVITEGHILRFKVLNLNDEETFSAKQTNNLMAVLLIESPRGYFLYWYRILENTYMLYSTWPVRRQIQDMEFVREENQYELLLLESDETNLEGQSSIDIYGFNVDYNNPHIDIWFCRRLFVPKIFNVQVCPIYGRNMLAFQGVDNVVLYESKHEDKLSNCQFEEFEVIESNKLTNFVCFENGYIEYLAIGGKKPRLLHFVENEFQDTIETNLHFNGTEISWIIAVPLNTYRDESLLLIQLKNLTVIALAWQGSKFKTIPLPNQIMNNFNLSKIVVIPKIGFVHKNALVRIEVILNELSYSIHDETESMLKTQALLEEVYRKQEAVFDETETRLNQSYLENLITGFWNLSKVNVTNATIKRDVNYGTVKIGSIDLGIEDIATNVTSSLNKLTNFEADLDTILPDLENMTISMKLNLSSDIELTGDFLVNGTLYAKSITAAFINNVSTSIGENEIVNREADVIINGKKFFPSFDTINLTVFSLNGIPLEEILFDTLIKNYSDVDFSELRRLEVEGQLKFSEINDIKWEELMQNIVWKDKSAIISGETIVEELIAEEASVETLNYLQYPKEYVLINDKFPINVTGEKHFVNLSTTHLMNINTINRIHIDDFIILSRNEIIDQEITFEDLEIGGILQLDGNITGININDVEGLLNETDKLSSDVIFENLIVMGNIVLQDSIDTKTWSDLDDLLLKTDRNAVIIGNKTFFNDVSINTNATILSGQINEHLFSEFVTLNTIQQFPYLKKISANVMFDNVTLGTVKKLEDYITYEQDIASGCLNKILFINSPVIDDLSFDSLEQNISQATFFDKLNQMFQEIHFENLTFSTLIADEVLPNIINGINYTDLAKRVLTIYTQQNLTGALIVDSLETDVLDAEIINGIPLKEFNRLSAYATSFYKDIFNGNASIKSLQVTGIITASSINDIVDIYKKDSMPTVIFNKNVSIDDLTVIGFVNGLNLSMFVNDAVKKIDKNITFIGHKRFENLTCEFLEVQLINNHFVDDILDPTKMQILKGPVVLNGSVTVLENFGTSGKIGSVFFSDFVNRFKPLGNNSYVLRGNFYFNQIASITKLNVSGPIQESTFDSFLKTVISKNDENVTISGSKLFKSPITFNSAFIIDGSLNDLNLHRFYESAIYIDKPFSIDTKIKFNEDIHIQKDLVVKTKLQSNNIMGVDIKELQENVVALNKPRYFPTRMTLDNVTFQANIKVAQVNDLQMDLLIPLHTRQLIKVNKFNCANISVRNIEILGQVNTYFLQDIYTDTFMVHGNQNIMGNIKIQGNVYAYHDFNAHRINNFNPKRIISLSASDTLIGNFIFKSPVVFDKSLRILGHLNEINPIHWQGVAIKTTNETKQIISGKWKVHGNVHFEKNIDGNNFLDGVNVMEISTALTEAHPQLDPIIEKSHKNLDNICTFHLDTLKCNAANQMYKFNTFDYLKIQEFEGNIHDISIVELNNLDYILVNYDVCRMKLLLYSEINFQAVDEVSDFGLIDQWIFFKSNRVPHLLTIAKRTCGRSLNNIWKLENNKVMHVLELGNVTNIMDLYQDTFVAMTENHEIVRGNLKSDILDVLISHKKEMLNTIPNNNSIMSVNQSLVHELQRRSANYTDLINCSDCGTLLSFRVGIYEREEYIYYDEEFSQNYIYLCKNDISQTKILQIIKARRPKSFLVLNFDGLIETLLIFVENNDTIQIYEYRGIEGFVYRNAIKMKVDKLYNFKIRKYTNMEKRHCLAAVHKNRLTIFEAKMYGEKLDLRTSAMDSCPTNICSIY